MGKGGKGKGGGYPWWEHLKKGSSKGGDAGGGGGGGGWAGDSAPRQAKPKTTGTSLQKHLERLEDGNYPAYNDLKGSPWDMEGCGGAQVFFDRIQGDPYAPPSWLRVRLPMASAKFPAEFVTKTQVRNIALCDYLTRVLSDMLRGGTGTDWTQAVSGGGWGGSKGGDLSLESPGQYVLPRSCVVANSDFIEARLTMSLPARGRRIEGRRAADIVGGLMDAVAKSLYYSAIDQDALREHILCVEDQEAARSQLDSLGLVAFVANGSILPRKSGVDERPMTKKDDPNLVVFESPESLEVTLRVPNKGAIRGMGVKKGITLIVGGGFHGKSTLLQALQLGVYNKVTGDGREFVVCDPNAVKVRSEDGRFVGACNISAFINNLPFSRDTSAFTTSDASGSTSQAANIMESLELGATAFFIDEDTCATNFMIRDAPMVELVAPEKEPITPFIKRVRPLYDDLSVSTIMVIGGSGDFFPVADTVICMERYEVTDVTSRAKEIAANHGREIPQAMPLPKSSKVRVLQREGLAAEGKVSAKSLRCIAYGDTEIELTFVEQLVEVGQAKAIMDCIQHLAASPKYIDGSRPFTESIELIHAALSGFDKSVGQQGLDVISRDYPSPFHTLPRRFELAAALNRLRTTRFSQRASERPTKQARQ